MDTLRSAFGSPEFGYESYSEADEDDGVVAPLPTPVGQDERRMQVRAYNFWASLLEDRNFPLVEDLDPANLPDFGPYSVLLDFSTGIDDPLVPFIGHELAAECGAGQRIDRLSDVPSRSLLSRITDHYLQILANQAPIGFEAEFVNQRGATILYRGILLPFSSDDDTIDFIYGVINWKELADQLTTDELLLEIDQALEASEEEAPLVLRDSEALADWADAPVATDDDGRDGELPALPQPRFGQLAATGSDALGEDAYFTDEGEDDEEDEGSHAGYASLLGSIGDAPPLGMGYAPDDAAVADELNGDAPARPVKRPVLLAAEEDFAAPAGFALADEANDLTDGLDLAGFEDAGGLYDTLAAARAAAETARTSEDRTRGALYAAVGRAYDVSLAAAAAPEDFAELVAESGLTVQDRAPMTPVVKLVFGADYDKTRLTEYAAVLDHAHRVGLGRGELAGFLSAAEGGLKGVVQAERRLRREAAGKPVEQSGALREALARKLRRLEPQDLLAIPAEGPEFALVMIRRLADGTVALVGEVDDMPLLERAARKLTA